MIKKTIAYTTFDGERITEDYYFNITKTEAMKLQFEDSSRSFSDMLTDAIKTKDAGLLIRCIEKLILTAYGVKSEDGKRFIKSNQLRNEFSQSLAFEALFDEMLTNPGETTSFLEKVFPAGTMTINAEAEKK